MEPADENGTAGPVLDLEVFNGGSFGASGGMFSLPGNVPEIIPAIISRSSYVNIHTEAHPGGEIRGQIHH